MMLGGPLSTADLGETDKSREWVQAVGKSQDREEAGKTRKLSQGCKGPSERVQQRPQGYSPILGGMQAAGGDPRPCVGLTIHWSPEINKR